MMEPAAEKLKMEFDAHIQMHKDFELKNSRAMLEINMQQKRNTEDIGRLTTSTLGLVETWTAANALSKFIKWVASFAVVGAGVAWVSDFFKLFDT